MVRTVRDTISRRRGVLRGLRLFTAMLGVAIAIAAFGAGGAWATTVQINKGDLRIFAHTGETNDVTVTPGAGTSYIVRELDPVATFNVPVDTVGLRCTQTGAKEATCDSGFAGVIVVGLRDLEDSVSIDSAITEGTNLRGGDGNDEITGGSGPDFIDPDSGEDIVNGGAGNDVIHTRSSFPPDHHDVASCGSGTDRIAADLKDNFSSCESLWLYGTNGDDRFSGTDRGDHLYGLRGNDVISGGDGPDSIFGGPHNDRLGGGSGRDRLVGRSGNDVLRGGPARDAYSAGRGNDVVRAVDRKRELIRCGSGRDTAYVNRGDRTRSCERVIRR
jgi:Ca2+-binding RTX toxin-like protein